MNIARFEPWTLMNLLQRDFDQLAGRRMGYGTTDEIGNSVADWVPAVDVVEEKQRFVLVADLPGVAPEDIDVNMENGVLSLSGERSGEQMRYLMDAVLSEEPLVRKQYVSCAHPNTLDELDRVEKDMLLSMAVFVGKTRLIDT